MASATDEASRQTDCLFRALYLRREYAVISRAFTLSATTDAMKSRGAFPSNVLVFPPPNLSASMEPQELSDSDEVDGVERRERLGNRRHDPSWEGLVTVTDPTSPWRGGCFAFSLVIPSRYPFECPRVELQGRWCSHPFLTAIPAEKHTEALPGHSPAPRPPLPSDVLQVFELPLDAVYASTDPLRISVMARALQHLSAAFAPEQWTPTFLRLVTGSDSVTRETLLASINPLKASQDMERCSVTQEVLLGKPYVDYLHSQAVRELLQEAQCQEKWVSWYGQKFLPHVLKTP